MQQTEYELLRHVWFPVARVADLGNGVASGNILGDNLVVYRSGTATTVAAGPCPHRGAALAMGRIVDGALECPYHGWLFAPVTGRCTHIPSLPSGVSSTKVSLRTYPTRIAYGLVWSCLEEPYLPFPRLASDIDHTWEIATGNPYDLRCGMRQVTENFRDKAHFPFVHSTSMGPDVDRVVEPYRVVRNGWELTWTLSAGLESTAKSILDYRILLPMFASIRIRSPEGGQRLVAQFATPITADGTRVRQYWLAGIDRTAAARGTRLADVVQYERQVFEEDHPIVENRYPVEAPLDLDSQVHTPADRFSIVYRRTYSELLQHFHQCTTQPSLVALSANSHRSRHDE